MKMQVVMSELKLRPPKNLPFSAACKPAGETPALRKPFPSHGRYCKVIFRVSGRWRDELPTMKS